MVEPVSTGSGAVIPQETLLIRLEQSEELREFTVQMWLQNPTLARQGGARVRALLKPLHEQPSAR